MNSLASDAIATKARPPLAQFRRWRFIGLFGGALVLYFLATAGLQLPNRDYAQQHPLVATAVSASQGIKQRVFEPYQRLIANSASTVLRLLGQSTEVVDRQIRSPRFAVSITHGCDAIELSLLLVAAILAFPAAARDRARGIALGILVVGGCNFIRVVGLWLLGAYWRGGFDLVHFSIAPLGLIVVAALFFRAWTRTIPATVNADGA